MPQLMPITSASWAMIRRKKLSAANPTSVALDWTTKATPALIIRPTNIHTKAWVRNAWASRASGLTPRADGEAAVPGARSGVRYGLETRWSLMSGCSYRKSGDGSPHQAGVARVPALGQERDLDVVLDDGLGLL